MALRRPRNYKELVQMKRCAQLHSMIPQLTPSQVDRIFDFISQPDCSVTVSAGVLSLRDANDVPVEVINVPSSFSYNYILLSSAVFHISRPSSSGGGSDSGSSGNNNNNNNNNNNG